MKRSGTGGIPGGNVSAAGRQGDAATLPPGMPQVATSKFPAAYPRAILHFDGDSFFASVEQAMNHKLRGLPIVTGAERGAATALSIEAKRLGLSRGMSMKEIREKCPEVIVVKSDYTAYSVYARRMYAIVRRYTPVVEEYSIDECFADITGLERLYGLCYEDIARMIKRDLETSLGITFGVGLGPSKVVAKIGSKFNKPAGFTPIPAHKISTFLKDLKVGSLWGIGSAMTLSKRCQEPFLNNGEPGTNSFSPSLRNFRDPDSRSSLLAWQHSVFRFPSAGNADCLLRVTPNENGPA